jgi:hypothetical protein
LRREKKKNSGVLFWEQVKIQLLFRNSGASMSWHSAALQRDKSKAVRENVTNLSTTLERIMQLINAIKSFLPEVHAFSDE